MNNVLSEKLALVSLNISVFSGFRRATRENIAALGGSLPACNAITEGSIKIFPCDGTQPLLAVRRRLFRKLQAKGVRALGSQNVFAVLTDELPGIEREISAAQSAFDAARDSLRADYDRIFEEHVAANSEAETVIRSLKVGKDEAVSKCRFGMDVFRIAPFVREDQSAEEGVEGIVRGLGRKLYEECAEEMTKLLKNEAFKLRFRVGQKTLRPLRAQKEKLKKLSFLEPSLDGATRLVEETLGRLPAEGYIEGQPYQMLEKLIEVMSDPDALLNAASKVKNGICACDVLFPLDATASMPEGIQAGVGLGRANSGSDSLLPIACPAQGINRNETPGLPTIVQTAAQNFLPLRERAGKPQLFF